MTKIEKSHINFNERQWVSGQLSKKRLELVNLIEEEILDTKQRLEELRNKLAETEYEIDLTKMNYRQSASEYDATVQDVDNQPQKFLIPERPVSVTSKSPDQFCRNCIGTFCSSSCLNELKEFLKQLALNNKVSLTPTSTENSTPQSVQKETIFNNQKISSTGSCSPIKRSKETVSDCVDQSNGLAHLITDKINNQLSSIVQNLFASYEKPSKESQVSSTSPISFEELPMSNECRSIRTETSSGNFDHDHVHPSTVTETKTKLEDQQDTFSPNENILIELENLLLNDNTQYLGLPEKRSNSRKKGNYIPFAEPQSDQFKHDISIKMFQNKQNDPLFPPFERPHSTSAMFKMIREEESSKSPKNSVKQNSKSNISSSASFKYTNDQSEMEREEFWNDILNNKHSSFGDLTL